MQMTMIKTLVTMSLLLWRMQSGGPPTFKNLSLLQDQRCVIDQVPIETLIEDVPLRLAEGRLVSSGEGPTYADVKATNTSSLPIRQFSFVLDYLDPSGNSLGQVQFAEIENQKHTKGLWPIHAEYRDDSLLRPLDVGAIRSIHGMTATFLSGCPTRARLIFLGVQFSNDTVRSWSVPNWSIGPTLNFFSSSLEYKLSDSNNGSAVLSMKASINEEGHIVGLAPLGNTQIAEAESFLPQFRNWIFFPALKEGKPSESQITLVFHFLASEAIHIPIDAELSGSSPSILIKAIPDTSEPNKWRLFCEWRGGDSFLETP